MANALTNSSAISVNSGATLTLNGNSQTLSNLTNSGTVRFGTAAAVSSTAFESSPGTVLTVKGDYVGNSGKVIMNTFLGGDSSPTDRLVLDGGHASGNTALVIKHGNSPGGQTTRGIEVVQALNGATTENTAFSLSSESDGYRLGVGTIAAGAYDYSLQRGGNAGSAQSWYLVSTCGNNCSAALFAQPQPRMRPEVGAYFNNRLAAATMQFQTLHDRQSQAPGFAGNESEAGDQEANGWVRISGQTSSRQGVDGLDLSNTGYLARAGDDVMRFSVGQGSVRMGVMGQYGSNNSRADNGMLSARGSVDGYSAGVYGTWYGNADPLRGLYVDTWMMFGIFNNYVQGQGLSAESYRSRNMSGSVEMGYTISVREEDNARLSLQPQAQVIVSNYRSSNHTERTGTVISGQSGTDITTRLGLALRGGIENDQLKRSVFTEINWWHGPASQAMAFDGAVIKDTLPANRLEGRVGIQGNVTRALSAWSTLGFEVGANSYQAAKMQIGAKYQW